MTDYSELVKALRCANRYKNFTKDCDSQNPNEPCRYCHHWLCEDDRIFEDAAAAIEELQQIADHYEQTAKDYWKEACEYKAQLPKRGEWNNHEVACLLAEMFGDDCACNLNGIDEWLPQYCEFAETCCPNPVGVACWEQFLKHRAKMEAQE